MSNHAYSNSSTRFTLPSFNMDKQRKLFIGLILLMALLAFEIFNFDTTQFALQSLLGDVKFLGILWATILAIAFCSIDFAGLIRLFSPEHASGGSKEAWYLMGAWLLGATMNAVMTWWAVSLTLLNNDFGNEVLSREQLLRYVPIFVAVLVWLTRILFIGAFSIAGEQLFNSRSSRVPKAGGGSSQRRAPATASSRRRQAAPSRIKAAPKPAPKPVPQPTQSVPQASQLSEPFPPPTAATPPAPQNSSRVRQRPPMPNSRLRKPGSRIQARRRS